MKHSHRFRILMHVEVESDSQLRPTEAEVKKLLSTALKIVKATPEFHDVDYAPKLKGLK